MEYRKCVRQVKVYKNENDTAFIGEKLIQLTILQIESTLKQICCERCCKFKKYILWERQVAPLQEELGLGHRAMQVPLGTQARGEDPMTIKPRGEKEAQGRSKWHCLGLVGEVSGTPLEIRGPRAVANLIHFNRKRWNHICILTEGTASLRSEPQPSS